MCGTLVNVDSGEKIPYAFWADIQDDPKRAGRFGAYVLGIDGFPLTPRRRYYGRCRLRFDLAKTGTPTQQGVLGTSPPRPVPRRGVPVLMLKDRPCQHYGCIRLASWMTSEEEEMPVEVDRFGRRFERARMLRARFWCSWHYEWPTLRHSDGEIEKNTLVKARPD